MAEIGRPSIFTDELATTICKRIADGESLRAICREEGMPHRATVHAWLLDETKKAFYDQYEKACNTRAENMFDELLEIADDGSNDYMEREYDSGETREVINNEAIQRSRLRVDTRKWYLSKVLPKKYADKQLLGDPNDQPITVAAFSLTRNENNNAGNPAND